ncbi:MAG: two-component sensor histidine kinase [Rhodobacteraceae bacterium]|nr:two-component sensor histidine kinase [Paracoccaceae bacterium]
MSDNHDNTSGADEGASASSPFKRLYEVRWLLYVTAVMFFLGTVLYEIPAVTAFIAFLLLVFVGAVLPRRTQTRRLQVSVQRELRRMWPGTGMKVTVDAIPTPCFVADARGITRYINRAALDCYGSMSPGDPLSFSLRAPSLLEAFDRVGNSGTPESISWTEKVPTEAWFEAYLSPVYMPGAGLDPEGKPSPDFVLVVIRDLTEQKRLERMRTDFVANASHELRTPLASLTGFIETLQGPAKDDEDARNRFLGIMQEQASRMRRLIDDILSLSRIELRSHVRPAAMVNLVEIAKHTVDALGPLARDMEVEISLQSDQPDVSIRGDRDELIQVAENLVENALKYGRSGGRVEILIERFGRSGEEGSWSLAVRDFGQGISAEHLPRLTERFYRVDEDSSRTMQGTGLGLAIVKHIINRHRARLDVESKLGSGSTFRVVFPEQKPV